MAKRHFMIPSKPDSLFLIPLSICSGDIVNYMENHKRSEFGILSRSVKEEPKLAYYNDGKAVKALDPAWI